MNFPDLVPLFLSIAAFSVPSKQEHEIRDFLSNKLELLGFSTSVDSVFPDTDSGNLYARLEGTLPGDPILFSAHMDTVTPCENKQITVEENGRIHTDGTTILGSDDISGIVEILCASEYLVRNQIPHRSIEVVFSASEEFFTEGSKYIDYSRISAVDTYVMDTDGEIGRAVLAGPAGIRIRGEFFGKASHAALKPEDGVNAISAASKAVSGMRLGRIDSETTANIGIIRGGISGNIVPETCFLEGETRSLSHDSAIAQCDHMIACMKSGAELVGARVETIVDLVYDAWKTESDSNAAVRFRQACEDSGIACSFESACGGSDANNLAVNGKQCVVAATGMHNIHSTNEFTTIQEMEKMTEVVVRLMTSNI